MTTPIITFQSVIDWIDILTNVVLSNKQLLNIDEASAFTGFAKSYLCKLALTEEM